MSRSFRRKRWGFRGPAFVRVRLSTQDDRNLAAFEDFLRHKLTRIPSVAGVSSSFALRPIVYRTALPVGRVGTPDATQPVARR